MQKLHHAIVSGKRRNGGIPMAEPRSCLSADCRSSLMVILSKFSREGASKRIEKIR